MESTPNPLTMHIKNPAPGVDISNPTDIPPTTPPTTPPGISIDNPNNKDSDNDLMLFDLPLRIRKVQAKKPKTIVSSEDDFCATLPLKIQKVNALFNIPDIDEIFKDLENITDPTDPKMITIIEKIKNTDLAPYCEQKDGSKKTPAERIRHKINTARMYQGLEARQSPDKSMMIVDTKTNKAMIKISRVFIDEKSSVCIESQQFSASNKQLWMMVEYARDHSSNRSFKITDCEDNPEAAMKLFIFGIAAGLHHPDFIDNQKTDQKTDQKTNQKTLESIANYPNQKTPEPDQILVQIYEAARNPDANPEDIISQLKAWEQKNKEKKKESKENQPHKPKLNP